MEKRFVLQGLLVALALVASGCSSSDEEGGASQSTTTLRPGYEAVCKTDELEARVKSEADQNGEKVLTIGLTNKSDDFCALEGFPSVTLMSGNDTVPATTERTNGRAIGISIRQTVAVYFDIQYAGSAQAAAACPKVNRILIDPQGSGQTLRLPLSSTQGLAVCGTAKVTVSPIRPNAQRS